MNINAGSAIALTASPGTEKAFSSWGGACAGQPGTTCNFTMDSDKTVSATFVDNRLTVVREGDGSGTVTANSGQISCGNKCSDNYSIGATPTLTASAASGSRFGGWSEAEGPAGNCGSNTTCQVTMNGPRSVTATFIDLDDITVNFTGGGTGTVTWNPTAPACSSNCVRTFDDGTNVVITAVESASSLFQSWSGCSMAVGPVCNVNNLSSNTNVTVNFAAAQALAVTIVGAGSVTSAPAGVNCNAGTCNAKFLDDEMVTLTATTTGTFDGWTGDCASAGTTPTCMLTMDAAKNVTATFSN
jgi:uncharacterized repeat protein (TIGR02543 family)